MRPLALAPALLALLLAGCASAPPPLQQGEPTFHDAPARVSAAPAQLMWMTLAQAELTLTPSDSILTLSVPNGTLDARVNFTLVSGAAYGLDVRMGECRWARATSFVAEHQTITADCGSLVSGQDTLAVATTGGALDTRVSVDALVCLWQPGHQRCPGAAPAGS